MLETISITIADRHSASTSNRVFNTSNAKLLKKAIDTFIKQSNYRRFDLVAEESLDNYPEVIQDILEEFGIVN